MRCSKRGVGTTGFEVRVPNDYDLNDLETLQECLSEIVVRVVDANKGAWYENKIGQCFIVNAEKIWPTWEYELCNIEDEGLLISEEHCVKVPYIIEDKIIRFLI
jgi:hypothetical protein